MVRRGENLKARQYREIQGDDKTLTKDVWKRTAKNIVNMGTEAPISSTDRRMAFQISQIINQIKNIFTGAIDNITALIQEGVSLKGINDTTIGIMSKVSNLWDTLIGYLNYIGLNRMSQKDIQAVYALIDTIIPLIDKYETIIDEANDSGIYVPAFKGLEDFRNKIEVKDLTPLTQLVYSKQTLLKNLYQGLKSEDEKLDTNLNIGTLKEAQNLLKRNDLEGLTVAQLEKELTAAQKKYESHNDKLRKIQTGTASSYVRSRRRAYESEIGPLADRIRDLTYAIQNNITSQSIMKLEKPIKEEIKRSVPLKQEQSSSSSQSQEMPGLEYPSSQEEEEEGSGRYIEQEDSTTLQSTLQTEATARPSLAPVRTMKLKDVPRISFQRRPLTEMMNVIEASINEPEKLENAYRIAIQERDRAIEEGRDDDVRAYNELINRILATPQGARISQMIGEGRMRRARRNQQQSYLPIDNIRINYL